MTLSIAWTCPLRVGTTVGFDPFGALVQRRRLVEPPLCEAQVAEAEDALRVEPQALGRLIVRGGGVERAALREEQGQVLVAGEAVGIVRERVGPERLRIVPHGHLTPGSDPEHGAPQREDDGRDARRQLERAGQLAEPRCRREGEPHPGQVEVAVRHERVALVAVPHHAQDEDLRVSVQRNQIVFVLGRTILSSRLIEGQFPNYRQLLPESFEHELRVASGELTEVVRRISLLAQKNAPLRLAFAQGELTVSAQTPDVGEARESLPVAFEGEVLEIGFNPEFLRAGLEAIEEGDVLLKLISPLRPGLIEAADGSGFQYLIMPIRLNV